MLYFYRFRNSLQYSSNLTQQMQPQKNQLIVKHQTDESFRKEMLKAQQNYKILKQHAHYSDLKGVNQILLTKFEPDKKLTFDTYFIYGLFLDQKKVLMDTVTRYFVTVFPKPRKPYIFVYFNDPESANNFNNFKNMLSIMPLDFLTNLQTLYVVRPSLRMRATQYFIFGTIAKYLASKIQYIGSIEELSQKLQVNSHQIMNFLPLDVRMDFSEQQITINKPVFMNSTTHTNLTKTSVPKVPSKYQFKNASESPSNQMTMSTKPLTTSSGPATSSLQIDQYNKSQRGIPEVFQVLIHYFREHPQQLDEQGLFRKSQFALQKMKEKHYEHLQKVKDPHLVANLIKRFFSKLKTPIIPFNIFAEMMNANNLSVEFIAEQIRKLSNQSTTKYLSLMMLLDFMIRKVIPRSNKNKMNAQNIAICFAPCLMWAEQRSIKDLAYINKSVAIVTLMITHFQQIFGTKEDVKRVFRSSYLKKISQSYRFTLPQNVQLEEVRKTPYFGELVLQKAQQQIKQAEQQAYQESQIIGANTLKVNIISPTKNTKSQSEAKQYRQDPDQRKSDRLTKNKSIDCNTQLEPPTNNQRKKGIFTSKSTQKDAPQSQKSQSSQKSDKAQSGGISDK